MDILRLTPSSATIESNFNTAMSRSNSGYVTTVDFTGGWWTIDATMPNLPRHISDRYLAFIDDKRGNATRFQLILSKYSDSKSNYRGTITVVGTPSLGSSVAIETSNPQAVENEIILRRGDFIKFASTDKVYRVTEDIKSDLSGQATLRVSPNLITVPIANSNVIFRSVPFIVVMQSNSNSFTTNSKFRTQLNSLQFEEAFRT